MDDIPLAAYWALSSGNRRRRLLETLTVRQAELESFKLGTATRLESLEPGDLSRKSGLANCERPTALPDPRSLGR
jgi:hypothetical protein